MKVRIINLIGGKPESFVLPAGNVIIETDDGKAIAAAVAVGNGLEVVDFRDKNFRAMLRNLGVDVNVDFDVDWVKPQPVPAHYKPLEVGS